MNIKEEVVKMKMAAPVFAAMPESARNAALSAVAESLATNQAEIFAANHADMDAAKKSGVSAAVMKRLKFDESKLWDVLAGIRHLIALSDPLGVQTMERELDEGLVLRRVSVPIGVIGVIFEARPDALVQISALCIKSGNCAILKGGKETVHTNRILFRLIHEATVKAGVPSECLLQAELHNEIDELLACDLEVDLLIPRGSNSFVQYIMNHTKIPVMGHADGVCHIYVDKDADQDMAIRIILDAKMQYTAACNAVETILVHREIAKQFIPKLSDAFAQEGIKLRGTAEVSDYLAGAPAFETMEDAEFHMEYLELIASVKLVANVEEAAFHINRFGSHHTDAIVTSSDAASEYFMQHVDSAGVYRNCSTRFADGFRYGFGAEVGISTSKLHARGPVGLEGLVTYQYRLEGSGQIVAPYANGEKEFHHKDLI